MYSSCRTIWVVFAVCIRVDKSIRNTQIYFILQGGCSDDVQKLHTLICNAWNSTFSKDFPFYLTLVHRVEHL